MTVSSIQMGLRFSLWRQATPLILASRSAPRRLLLENAGIPILPESHVIDERAYGAGWSGARISRGLAVLKAVDVSKRFPDQYVLGADQTMAIGSDVFSKPASIEEAAGHLRLMSGRSHILVSSGAVARNGAVLFQASDRARMDVRVLSDDFIGNYLAAAGAGILDCVGAYEAEGAGIHLFDRVHGDYATILGLPLMKLLAYFRGAGLIAG